MDLLLVLNPRRILECMQALEELPIRRLWIRNLTETQIEERWQTVMELAEGHDRLLICSDDAIPRPHALAAVLELLDEGHPVVTGYSNLDARDLRVNLDRAPLQHGNPTIESHDFYRLGEVLSWPSKVVPTTLCGFSLTGMSYELWQRFPFQAEYGSDTNLSFRLDGAGIPIVGARDAFLWHVKENWNMRDEDPRKRFLIGEEPPLIELEH